MCACVCVCVCTRCVCTLCVWGGGGGGGELGCLLSDNFCVANTLFFMLAGHVIVPYNGLQHRLVYIVSPYCSSLTCIFGTRRYHHLHWKRLGVEQDDLTNISLHIPAFTMS